MTTNEIMGVAVDLKAACAAIAQVCNGATTRDDVGFNKADTSFGRFVATIPADMWSAEQCGVVRAMLRKYTRQLAGAGVEYAALPGVRFEADVPEGARSGALARFKEQQELVDQAAERAAWAEGRLTRGQFVTLKKVPVAYVENGAVALEFPYDAALVAEVKALPRRKWDGRRWLVGRGSEAALAAFVERHAVACTADVATWVAAAPAPEAAAPALPNFRIEGDRVVLCAPYNADALEPLRQVVGRRWDAARKVNTFPLVAETVAQLGQLAARFGWTGIEQVRAAADSVCARAAAMATASEAATSASKAAELGVADVGNGTLQLRPFQLAGVEYALAADARTFIGDDMGLGKTVQALAVLHARQAFPALVVCPKAVKRNWRNEAQRWLPAARTVAVVNGGRDLPAPADLLIINYDVLAKHEAALAARGFRAIVVDESQMIKERPQRARRAGEEEGKRRSGCQRSRVVVDLARNIPIRLALTGTAVVNKPVDLINQLTYLGRLDDFGGFWGFAKRYCGARRTRYGWDLTGASNLDELARRLREVCYVWREKRDVAPELPPIQRSVVPVELDDPEGYARALADVVTWMRGQRAHAEAFGRTADEKRAYHAEALVRIEGMKQLIAAHKIGSCVEWIANYLDTTEGKLVVFAHHKDVQDRLYESLAAYAPARFHADDGEAVREAQVQRFWHDPACRVLVASLQAGGVGNNWQCAQAVVKVEFGWNPAIHDQAEGRIHRIGSEAESINSYWLTAEGTFEDDILALIEHKRAVVDAINRGEAAALGAEEAVADWFERVVEGRAAAADAGRAFGRD